MYDNKRDRADYSAHIRNVLGDFTNDIEKGNANAILINGPIIMTNPNVPGNCNIITKWSSQGSGTIGASEDINSVANDVMLQANSIFENGEVLYIKNPEYCLAKSAIGGSDSLFALINSTANGEICLDNAIVGKDADFCGSW